MAHPDWGTIAPSTPSKMAGCTFWLSESGTAGKSTGSRTNPPLCAFMAENGLRVKTRRNPHKSPVFIGVCEGLRLEARTGIEPVYEVLQTVIMSFIFNML